MGQTKQQTITDIDQHYQTQTPENDIYIRDVTYGDSKILYSGWDSVNYYEVTYPYNAQLLTLSGTGADYSDFNVGDIIRPVGQYEFPYRGVIKSISGADFEISSDYVYQIGDIVEAVNPTNSQVSTRYLVISSTGVVTGTVGSDPGYVSVGPNTNQTLTFPDLHSIQVMHLIMIFLLEQLLRSLHSPPTLLAAVILVHLTLLLLLDIKK